MTTKILKELDNPFWIWGFLVGGDGTRLANGLGCWLEVLPLFFFAYKLVG